MSCKASNNRPLIFSTPIESNTEPPTPGCKQEVNTIPMYENMKYHAIECRYLLEEQIMMSFSECCQGQMQTDRGSKCGCAIHVSPYD